MGENYKLIGKIWTWIGVASLTSSCMKNEIPIPKHESGNVIKASVNLESNYRWQAYFDLESNQVVGMNLRTAWDLGFETSPDGFHVILNSSKSMFVYPKLGVTFDEIADTNGFALNRKWDNPNGNIDSTAFGNWKTQPAIYLIDRGYSENGLPLGFWKIQIQAVNSLAYTLRFAELGKEPKTIEIIKDSTYNWSFFSFENEGAQVKIEPPKTSWDLVFTQYTHVFYDQEPVVPYSVNGCLLNRLSTFAKMDSSIEFNSIDYAFAFQLGLSNHRNTIGYEWKSFTGQNFTTNPKMNYIIQTSEGHLFKLHFLDFYNSDGVKGNPTWEYQRL
jgi:hypothetical protein